MYINKLVFLHIILNKKYYQQKAHSNRAIKDQSSWFNIILTQLKKKIINLVKFEMVYDLKENQLKWISMSPFD